ncbi:hypothetical protein [Glutamicibacter sp. JC586]|nr:hypothetical protein [Glutamicibacter sp. JC586]
MSPSDGLLAVVNGIEEAVGDSTLKASVVLQALVTRISNRT